MLECDHEVPPASRKEEDCYNGITFKAQNCQVGKCG